MPNSGSAEVGEWRFRACAPRAHNLFGKDAEQSRKELVTRTYFALEKRSKVAAA
jgi:hypothetical protein